MVYTLCCTPLRMSQSQHVFVLSSSAARHIWHTTPFEKATSALKKMYKNDFTQCHSHEVLKPSSPSYTNFYSAMKAVYKATVSTAWLGSTITNLKYLQKAKGYAQGQERYFMQGYSRLLCKKASAAAIVSEQGIECQLHLKRYTSCNC